MTKKGHLVGSGKEGSRSKINFTFSTLSFPGIVCYSKGEWFVETVGTRRSHRLDEIMDLLLLADVELNINIITIIP